MACELTWLGHNCWLLETAGGRILLDPFLDDSPVAPVRSDHVAADYLLITHGHYDHSADAEKIAKRCKATIISNFEICQYYARRGIQATHGMNIGGSCKFPFGRVKMTQAWHTSTMPDGSDGGCPAGFLLMLPEGNVYFAGDTGLFGDMQWIGKAGLAMAALPIGDNFTMGPEDAIEAVRLLSPNRVVPIHYGTWPVIAQDAEAWARRVAEETDAEPIVAKPGMKFILEHGALSSKA